MKTLAFGIGNPLRGDDGVGARAALALAAEGFAARAVIQPLPEHALELASVDRVVFLDAALDSSPGVVRVRRISPKREATDPHALDAASVLGLCEALEGRAPEAFLVGVGVADLRFGEVLSPAVEAALPELIARARGLLGGGGRGRRIATRALWVVAVALLAWLVLEIGVRAYLEGPLEVDFYGSIPREAVREKQDLHGLVVAAGPRFAHLGFIADPERETYTIERRLDDGSHREIGTTRFGSFVVREAGTYRVRIDPRAGDEARFLGPVEAIPLEAEAPVLAPRIAGPWRPLFRPSIAGDYVNDHAIYRDATGRWRLLGITARGEGDYSAEVRFAAGVAQAFPPDSMMRETDPVADFGEIAWAPHVIEAKGGFRLFWSPHRLMAMTSPDGIAWRDPRVVMSAPASPFFRDAMVHEVAPGQWLLYATARGRYFSRVDLYQSFDLEGWQYIGPALDAGFGSERNSILSSMESPALLEVRGRYYLAITYNNDSGVLAPLLLPFRIWLDRASYNDTLVFESDHPYAFGTYRGASATPNLVARLAAHAAEWVHVPERDEWYVTTAGWPFVATLTSGEVAVAPLRFEPVVVPHRD